MKHLLSFYFLLATCLPAAAQNPFVYRPNPDSLEQVLKTLPPSIHKVDVLVLLSRNYFGQPDKIPTMLVQIKQLSDSLGYIKGQADYDYVQGILHYVRKEYPKASVNWQKAYNKYALAKDSLAMVRVSIKLGELHSGWQVGLETTSKKYPMAFYERAYRLGKQMNNPYCIVQASNAISILYHELGQYDKEVTYLDPAIKLAEKTPDIGMVLGDCYANRGIIYLKQKQYTEAIDLLQRSNNIYKVHPNFRGIVSNNYLIAKIYHIIGKIKEAKAVLLTQLPVIQNNNAFLNNQVDYYGLLTELYKQDQNYQQSLHYQQLLMTTKDSIVQSKERNDYKEWEVRYESEKKEAEAKLLAEQKTELELRNKLYMGAGLIVLLLLVVASWLGLYLKKLNIELNEANNEIKALNRTREYFWGLIAHDIRKPLTAYLDMGRLVSYNLKKGNYEAIQQISDGIDQSGFKIQQMVDNLLKWAMSQNEQLPYKPQSVVLYDKITDNVEMYQSLPDNKKVNFEINCPETLNLYADPDAIDLVLRNLIGNALNAITPTGNITVTATKEDNKTKLDVADNGKGIAPDLLPTIRKALADPLNAHIGHQGLGMGLIIAARFIQRNGGQVEVSSTPNQGTTFSVTFSA